MLVSFIPSAFSKVVTAILRRRSIFTNKAPLAAVSNSNHAPRLGITLAPYSLCPPWLLEVKNTPGLRISWLTTTRSAPFITKVPRPVIHG